MAECTHTVKAISLLSWRSTVSSSSRVMGCSGSWARTDSDATDVSARRLLLTSLSLDIPVMRSMGACCLLSAPSPPARLALSDASARMAPSDTRGVGALFGIGARVRGSNDRMARGEGS